MDYQPFKTLAFTHQGAIYAGKWRATPYSVTVRYKQREVSMSAARTERQKIAMALIIEMTQADRARAAGAERQAMSPAGP